MTETSGVAVRLTIEPELCGPVSVGTVAVIRLLVDRLGLSLSAALALVNRAVFDGEVVTVDVADRSRAAALAGAVEQLPPVPRVRVEIVE